ncbi:hypothetical protein GCM10009557_04210 [Virgisporangium ochraceum]|uniref:EAL domain-containing protein n=1 Tax=Virgisporangium ochraceum TaxID=65505 RepID=A0A8J4E8I9_9ACTN|nr:EAL domain-containing protein [Virgisporangium ochraceum]GIJ65726.1 hypothetical protein Voc01_006430 [Virgisporangium ochraceum]
MVRQLRDAWRTTSATEFRCRITARDGSTSFVEVLAEILTDGNGEPTGVIATGYDVTGTYKSGREEQRRLLRDGSVQKSLAEVDAATSLLSGRAFAEEVGRALRAGTGTLLVISVSPSSPGDGDPDDRFGVAAAKVLRDAVHSDACGLLGRLEFGVLMPYTTFETATPKAMDSGAVRLPASDPGHRTALRRGDRLAARQAGRRVAARAAPAALGRAAPRHLPYRHQVRDRAAPSPCTPSRCAIWSSTGPPGTRSSYGCRFGVDDFGTGNTPLGFLTKLPVDLVKIDGSFIDGLPASQPLQAVVRGLVQMCRGLGILTAAECVRDDATLALLREYGVDFAQGFHVGRPESFVAARRVRPALPESGSAVTGRAGSAGRAAPGAACC